MDKRIGKHLAKRLRIDTQRTTTNIHVGGVEELLSDVFVHQGKQLYENELSRLLLSLLSPYSLRSNGQDCMYPLSHPLYPSYPPSMP
jgi:hypothetical protein